MLIAQVAYPRKTALQAPEFGELSHRQIREGGAFGHRARKLK
jgi:hypothetical protein